MNAVAAKRSAIIKTIVKYDGDFRCTYEGQKDALIGNNLSTLFGEDHRADHAYFVMLLNREGSTPETFLRFFEGKLELLKYMLHFYKCNKLSEDIRAASILTKKKETVASFVDGIEARIAARRAMDLPMFAPE